MNTTSSLPPATTDAPEPFASAIRRMRPNGLVVQPRMGIGQPDQMRAGLLATRAANANTVGTITIDSYTRVGDHATVRNALQKGLALNGYPLVDVPLECTRSMLEGVMTPDFPIQVRHGSAQPERLFEVMTQLGLSATEGGPVSYCLPYGRTPLTQSIASWTDACELLVDRSDTPPHIETFGGCMLGQLCPPSMLLTLAILEALFFSHIGITSISLSYAQQTNSSQDLEALRALRRLADLYLPDTIDVHVVLYAYMGVFPSTEHGALSLLCEASRLCQAAGVERFIVKTKAEAHRIPTIDENIEALELAGAPHPPLQVTPDDSGVEAEAKTLIEAVLSLSADPGAALLKAFEQGVLDVPYCLHPDNRNQTRSYIDDSGRLFWSDTGQMPISVRQDTPPIQWGTSANLLLSNLTHVQRSFDSLSVPPTRASVTH